jgi:hypothetical protein
MALARKIHPLLACEAALRADATSDDGTLADFRAIGKTAPRFCSSPPDLQVPVEAGRVEKWNMQETRLRVIKAG